MATRRSSSLVRSHGKFVAKCGCLSHDVFDSSSSCSLLQSKTVCRRFSFLVLVQKKLISPKNKYVCKDCLDYSQHNFVQTSVLESSFSELNVSGATDTDSITFSDLDFSDVILPDNTDVLDKETIEDHNNIDLEGILRQLSSLHEWSKIDDKSRGLLCDIATKLGSLINLDLYEDGKSLQHDYRNQNLDKNEWVSHRNPLLLNFLQSATGCDKASTYGNVKKFNAFTHLLEQVYYSRNLKLITPFAFQRNVVSYSLTNSKICTNLTGNWESSGCYSSVHDYICADADPIKCPEGYVHCAIDNNQKVGRSSGRITEGSKVPVDVSTSVSNFKISDNTTFHNNESFAPSAWQNFGVGAFGIIVDKVNEYEKQYVDIFRLYRNQMISELLKEVSGDQIQNIHHDYVDISLRQKEMGLNNNVCCKCNYVYPLSNRNCPNCNHDPKYNPLGYDPYKRTPSQHLKHPPTVTVGEPCMVNPNNEEKIGIVLEHLREVCNIPEQRKWLVVWSDGIPYLFGMRLQQYVYVCSACEELVDTRKESLDDHTAKHNHDDSINFHRAFSDFIFRPGPGHIELNMAKCLLNFCWPILLPMVSALGFRTKKALDVVKRGTDHHRSKHILFTLFDALARELLVTHVRNSLESGTPVSLESFNNWVRDSVVDPNYLYLFDMCFTFLLAFKLYNEGIRKNNHEVVMAARIFFAPLFFAGNHPKYQELHLRDLCDRVQYPPELASEMKNTESFSVSGEFNKGQGADFVHEETNKFIKSFLPPGVPNAEIWQRVCRKSEMLKNLKDKCCSDLSQSSRYRLPRMDNEQLMMQRQVRSYLAGPCTPKPHVSLSGEVLDKHLYSFKSTGKRNYEAYKSNLATSDTYKGAELEPVFILKESRVEYEKIDNKTKSEILQQINNLVDVMPDNDCQQTLRAKLGTLKKNVKKVELIELYYEMCSELEDQLADETVPEIETDNIDTV